MGGWTDGSVRRGKKDVIFTKGKEVFGKRKL